LAALSWTAPNLSETASSPAASACREPLNPALTRTPGRLLPSENRSPPTLRRENLIEWGTATAEELDFLVMCVNNGVSLAIAGATGSGKTADMGYILSCIPNEKRIVTIEDTRELSLARYDENGAMINDVIHLLTKEAPNPDYHVGPIEAFAAPAPGDTCACGNARQRGPHCAGSGQNRPHDSQQLCTPTVPDQLMTAF
jgi:hypothetical protein